MPQIRPLDDVRNSPQHTTVVGHLTHVHRHQAKRRSHNNAASPSEGDGVTPSLATDGKNTPFWVYFRIPEKYKTRNKTNNPWELFIPNDTLFHMIASPSSNPPFKNTYSGACIVILVGLSSIGLGGYFFYAAWKVQGRPQRTTGTIVDIAARFTGNRGNLGYAPKVTFTTADHQLITFTNPVYSSGFRQKTGETITVYYSPDHPEQARVRMPVDSSAIWSILFGSLFFFLGIKSWQHVKET